LDSDAHSVNSVCLSYFIRKYDIIVCRMLHHYGRTGKVPTLLLRECQQLADMSETGGLSSMGQDLLQST